MAKPFSSCPFPILKEASAHHGIRPKLSYILHYFRMKYGSLLISWWVGGWKDDFYLTASGNM